MENHKQQPNCLEPKPELFKPLKLDEVDVSDGEEKNKKGKQKETKEDLEDSWLYLSDSSSNSGSDLDEPVMDDSSNQDRKFDESMSNNVVLGEFFFQVFCCLVTFKICFLMWSLKNIYLWCFSYESNFIFYR